MKTTKIIEFSRVLSATCLLGGILAIPAFREDPEMVSRLASISLFGVLVSYATIRFKAKLVNELFFAESAERSYLNQIRRHADNSQIIPKDLLEISRNLSEKAEERYETCYGFSRPYICSSVGIKKRNL